MSTPKITFYCLPGSCAMAPHILLREAGLEHDAKFLSKAEFFKAFSFPEEFLKLNPKGKVPVLVVDKEVITENAAIFTYISQLVPSKHFLGKTPLETVRAYEWFSYLSSAVHGQAYGMFYRPQRWIDSEDESLHKLVLTRAANMIKDCYSHIDAQLEGKKWALGDDFTAVDAYLFVFYQWGANSVQLPMEKDYPNFARIAGEVSKRPAVQEMLKVESSASKI